MPAVSVLLPARNAREHLEEAVRSVLAQSFRDLELVAVDDASTDGTAELLARLATEDARVRVVRGEGRGIAAALTVGLAECRAPLIARMDADDVCLPQRLERQKEALAADPALSGVGSQVEIFPRESMSDGLKAYEAWLNSLTSPEAVMRERLVESPLVHPAAMVRAEALRAVGGWRAEGWPEDWALWLRLLGAGHRLSNVPQVLLRWRDRPERLTRTHADYTPESHLRLKAFHLAQGPLRSGRCILWGAGKTGRALRRELRVLGIEIERFVDIDPRKIGRPLHGAPVVSPDRLGSFAGTHLVAAVGAKGARALIRQAMREKGWLEVEQFTFVG
jgi:glycosyltransferase involved in cell wall biosynthesis